MYRCDNEFIKENSDIREFSEFRDIMERVAGGEYAPGESASLLNTAHPARVRRGIKIIPY